ncbi:MFS transporter [Brucella tritici]|uniref:MFS transporter n=1 Tax=Brucella tritici TaxID=94626 RepID=UPI002E2D8B96|nr:MFS transporter [Brucella tritici]
MSFIYAIMVLARTAIVAAIPILALKFLGHANYISTLYLSVSLICLAFSLFLPRIISSIGLWRSLIMAALFGVLSAVSFLANNIWFLFPGLLFQFLMFTLFESAINIYTTQIIPRRDLSFFESRRVLFSGFTYLAGPLLCGWAIHKDILWLPIMLSGVCAICVPLLLKLLIPWAAKIQPAVQLAMPGFKDLVLFKSQPRLVLAWLLAVSRSSWWQVYTVYTPVFVVMAGFSSASVGPIIALGAGTLILAPFWQIISRRYGLRLTFFYGYLMCGVFTVTAGILGIDHPYWAVASLIGGALAISAVDSGGNAPFLRAVRPHQRIKMVPLYNTYRDIAQIVPSAIFAIILIYLNISSVFVFMGLFVMAISFYCLKLHKRL